ncbi:peptidylprolyl isomerase [Nanoarchaeota archaeon]
MTNTVKNGDFVEIEYSGHLKEDNKLFDTTDKEKAQKEGLFDPETQYGAKIVCIGQTQLLKGLDEQIIGKEIGKEHKFEIGSEQAFGKKSAKLIQMISASKFKEHKLNPMPGLQINVDGMMGIVKRAGGGRVLVDFNHPLAGHDLVYDLKINKIVTDIKEKVKSIMAMNLGQLEFDIEIQGDKALISFTPANVLPDSILKQLELKITEAIPEIKKLENKPGSKEKEKEPGGKSEGATKQPEKQAQKKEETAQPPEKQV